MLESSVKRSESDWGEMKVNGVEMQQIVAIPCFTQPKQGGG